MTSSGRITRCTVSVALGETDVWEAVRDPGQSTHKELSVCRQSQPRLGCALCRPRPRSPSPCPNGSASVQRLFTVDDVASFLNLAKKTVYAMSSAGRIPAIKIGSVLRFDPIELAD